MNDKSVDELVMSYLFPPSNDIAGMVLAKRYMVEDRHFDVIQADVKDDSDYDFKKCVDKYINEQILIPCDCNPNFPKCIFDFIDKSMEVLDKKDDYRKISTIVWKIANNFLALEYKLKHPDVYWVAEFSDPLLFGIYNDRLDIDKNKDIKDVGYISKINKAISKLNNQNGTEFRPIGDNTNVHFLVEYITYLFADEIVFTNENQRKIMLDQFPEDIKDFVMPKSVVSTHPTLPEYYYQIKKYEGTFDSSKINMGYFGNIYSKRHFEVLYQAFEVLNHKYKDKLQFHFYIFDKKLFNQIIDGLEIADNIIIKDTVDYLSFLNLTTKLDILIVNDLITSDSFKVNPYLPSKLSDYLGSGSDIWAICESGSALEKIDVKYKSNIHDYKSNVDVLVKILEDHSYVDEGFSVLSSDEYLEKRITQLNILISNEHKKLNNSQKRIIQLKNQNSKLKKQNNEILSSNSWKLTKGFRKIGKLR